jgi:Fur family iron response transcriptional regulator
MQDKHMQPARTIDRRPPRGRAAVWLTGAGLRPTRQRLALAELLIGDGRNRHVTAEGLHEAARRHGAPVSLATVYNTLRAFCGARLMQEVTVDGSRSYFDTRVDAHPHYYWEEDGRLTDAPTAAAVLAGPPQIPDGAELVRIDLVLRLRKAR